MLDFRSFKIISCGNRYKAWCGFRSPDFLTINVVDIKEELQFVHVTALHQHVKSIYQLGQTDRSTPIFIEQLEELLREEQLEKNNLEFNEVQDIVSVLIRFLIVR